jgi:regulatory subunit for Cdc7p protein kinase
MDVPINLLRERAYALYVQGIPWRGEQSPVNYQGWTEQDSTEETLAPDVQPYHQASGNSVVITSNIASTSTANYSPAFAANGLPALGANKDRAIMQMSKRVQVLKGNAAKAKLSPCPSSSSLLDPPARGSRIASAAGVAPRERTFMTHEQVLAMLRAQRAPFVEPEPIKVEKRIRNREKVEAGIRGIKDQDTSSGYCENCRLRYDDLSTVSSSSYLRKDIWLIL